MTTKLGLKGLCNCGANVGVILLMGLREFETEI